jgi:hypothetical protein
LQDIIDKTNRLEGARNDLQKQVDATNLRIKGEDDMINGIQNAGNKVNIILILRIFIIFSPGDC